MTAETRRCGPRCLFPDEPHRESEPDWIGDYPVLHGESDHQHPDPPIEVDYGAGVKLLQRRDNYCLCGHPEYGTCPEWWGGGIGGMTIERGPNWTPEFPGGDQ